MQRGATSPLNLTSLHYIMLTNAIADAQRAAYHFGLTLTFDGCKCIKALHCHSIQTLKKSNSNTTRLQTAPSLQWLSRGCAQAEMMSPTSFASIGCSAALLFHILCNASITWKWWQTTRYLVQAHDVKMPCCAMATTQQNGCNNNIWCQQASRLFHIVWRKSNNKQQGTISYAGAWYWHCGHSMATTIGRGNNIYCPWAVLLFHIASHDGDTISIPQAPHVSITCCSKAMTKNEVLHRRWQWLIIFVSRNGDNGNNRAMTTSYVDNELLSLFILTRAMATKKGTISCASTRHRTMAMTYHIASHDGDDDNKTTAVTTKLLPTSPSFVSYHIARWRWRTMRYNITRGRMISSYCVARWRRLFILRHATATTTTSRAMATTYHIASRDGDDLSYRVARWRRRQRVEHRRYNQLLKTST